MTKGKQKPTHKNRFKKKTTQDPTPLLQKTALCSPLVPVFVQGVVYYSLDIFVGGKMSHVVSRTYVTWNRHVFHCKKQSGSGLSGSSLKLI